MNTREELIEVMARAIWRSEAGLSGVWEDAKATQSYWTDECFLMARDVYTDLNAAGCVVVPMDTIEMNQIDRALHEHPPNPSHAPSKSWLRGFLRTWCAASPFAPETKP